MSYCSRCGNLTKEGAQFCDRCGTPLAGGFQSYGQGNQQTVSYTYRKDEKEAILAVVLSVLIPGLGQIYCGRIGRGIGIMVLMGLLSVVSIVPLFFMMDPWEVDIAGMFTAIVMVSIVSFIIYIWQIYDAYRCADDFNRTRPPVRY